MRNAPGERIETNLEKGKIRRNGFLHHFQHLRLHRDVTETWKWNEISFSSRKVPGDFQLQMDHRQPSKMLYIYIVSMPIH